MGRERKRLEAEDRNRRHKKLKPLKSRLEQVEKSLEQVMAKKDTAERELADPSIHQGAEKARLMKTLEIQKDLAQEESRLVIEWEELSTSIEELLAEFEKG
jgi:ATP-binding cassette subfamily F protein 3